MKVIKRNGTRDNFDGSKIEVAILKAMKYGSGIVRPIIAKDIAKEIESELNDYVNEVKISDIENLVFYKLIAKKQKATARSYEGYRAIQEFRRVENTIDGGVDDLLNLKKNETSNANSNKNPILLSTQRDLIAGEVSKDRMIRQDLPPHIVQAHKTGALWYHDMDYAMQKGMMNCCLINLGDMLDNGTCINGVKIDSPTTFQTACNVMTQIEAGVASNQYGGQSVDIKHLGKYLRRTYDKAHLHYLGLGFDNDISKLLATDIMLSELKSGVQTIQYQINTLNTSNGQSPFVTIFMNIEEGYEYEHEIALIIEEILKQRIQGVKSKTGEWITPTFPKLVYVENESNIPDDSKYRYLTKLARECTSKRMYPDYISAKKMKEHYDGNVFSPMGCRSFLSPWYDEDGNAKFEGRFNQGVVSINLPQIAIASNGDKDVFWELLETRLSLCFQALMYRHNSLLGTLSDVSPIHWQDGCIARLKSGETIDKLLYGGYSTLSLGYIGVYETTKLMTGESHTTGDGKDFGIELMQKLKSTVDKWKEETNIGFALYGTPAESLCYKFAQIDFEQFGSIEDVTDKGYYTNSYHVDVREEIDAFTKLSLEEDYQKISLGGCISYIEMPSVLKNPEALDDIIKFMYDNIQYAEFNTKFDNCFKCGYEGEFIINDDGEFECPSCNNKNEKTYRVVRRTCGYCGSNLWNKGKMKEFKLRYIHIGNEVLFNEVRRGYKNS